MIESFHSDDQAILSSHQLVLQLSHVCFISWFPQVVGKDVYKCIKQDYAGGRKGQGVKKKEIKDGLNIKVKPDELDSTCSEFQQKWNLCKMRFKKKFSQKNRNRECRFPFVQKAHDSI